MQQTTTAFTSNGVHAHDVSSEEWHVHEAPASCCLKFTIGDIEVMYTMRDTGDDPLFKRIKRILPKITSKLAEQEGTRTEQKDYCASHDVTMKQYTKGNKRWYAHKLANGTWCHGT